MSRRGFFRPRYRRPPPPTLPQRPDVQGVGSRPVDKSDDDGSDIEKELWSKPRQQDSDSGTETDDEDEDEETNDEDKDEDTEPHSGNWTTPFLKLTSHSSIGRK